MSIEFSIRIPIDLLPAPAVFIEELGPNWIELYEDEPDVHPLATMNQSVFPICPNLEEYGPDKWLYDRSYMFYLLNVSTRGLEVWYSDDAFHVKVLTLSHPAEWELAFQMLEFAVGGENALVETDWEPTNLRISELREVFDEERITEALHLQITSICDAIANDSGSVGLSGPINDFYIGPWFLERLDNAADQVEEYDEVCVETIFGGMLLVNYFRIMPDFDGIVILEYEEVEMFDGTTCVAVLLEPELLQFIPKVDYLMVAHADGERLLIPEEELKDYVSTYFREMDEVLWLDEHQFIVQPMSVKKYSKFANAVKRDFRPDGRKRKSGNLLNFFRKGIRRLNR